ncbi:hypothetical protein K3495_g5351 [Podosphaera aphanis]|nr:hypothetical protein K3495_g5351 [Podosphaera aphanis]
MEESLLLDFPNGECAPLPDSPLFNSEAEAFGWAQRKASTRGYAFSSLYKNKGKVTERWNWQQEVWILVQNNYKAQRNTSIAHPAHRIAALQNTLRAEILNVAKSGSSISQLMSAFRGREGFNFKGKDISNIIQKERQNKLGRMTPSQWLLKELQDNGYNPRFETKDGNILSKLMYFHSQAIQLWKNHPDVLLMDCVGNAQLLPCIS